MIKQTVAFDCSCEVCGHNWYSWTVPPRCASRECKSRKWNESAKDKTKPESLKPPKMIIERPKAQTEAREIEEPESDVEMCAYKEYDQESGETYACSLPLGHKVKHQRGRRL